MGLVSFSVVPVRGEPEDANDATTPLNELKTVINGNIDQDNIAASSIRTSELGVLDYARVSRGNVIIVNGTYTVPDIVTWSTEEKDTASMFDLAGAPTLLTIPTTGLYLITADVPVTAPNTTSTIAKAQITNGSTIIGESFMWSDTNVYQTYNRRLNVSTLAFCTAADQIKLRLGQDSAAAAAVTFGFGSELISMSAALISK